MAQTHWSWLCSRGLLGDVVRSWSFFSCTDAARSQHVSCPLSTRGGCGICTMYGRLFFRLKASSTGQVRERVAGPSFQTSPGAVACSSSLCLILQTPAVTHTCCWWGCPCLKPPCWPCGSDYVHQFPSFSMSAQHSLDVSVVWDRPGLNSYSGTTHSQEPILPARALLMPLILWFGFTRKVYYITPRIKLAGAPTSVWSSSFPMHDP